MTSDSGGSRSSGPWYASEPSTSPIPVIGPGPYRHARHGGGGRNKKRNIIIAAVVAVVVVIAAVVVVVVATSGSGKPATGFVPTGTSPDQDAQEITTAFIQAWKTGDLNQAARYTDRPALAQGALAGYRKTLHLRKLTGTAQSAAPVSGGGTRESVTFALNATVASAEGAGALHGTWSYHSKLAAYQKPNSNLWYIAWAPDVLAPNLTKTTHLAAVKVAPQVAGVSDASGNDITSYKDAGLTRIANLMEKAAPPGQGTPGLYVEIQNAAGKPEAGREQPGGRHRAEQHREPQHHDRPHGRGSGARRRHDAPQEFDGRHPAVYRQDPGHRQQRRLQQLRADR